MLVTQQEIEMIVNLWLGPRDRSGWVFIIHSHSYGNWSSCRGSVVANPTSIHKDKSLNPGLDQWVKDLMAGIWRCCDCGIGWQLQLWFNPTCHKCGPEKKKKKNWEHKSTSGLFKWEGQKEWPELGGRRKGDTCLTEWDLGGDTCNLQYNTSSQRVWCKQQHRLPSGDRARHHSTESFEENLWTLSQSNVFKCVK